jgi:hypothetical protein
MTEPWEKLLDLPPSLPSAPKPKPHPRGQVRVVATVPVPLSGPRRAPALEELAGPTIDEAIPEDYIRAEDQ